MTLHESCFTPATPYNIADGQILDLFPCTESPANLEPMTHNNSQYLSRLSLSSVPSNNPQLAANDNSATSSIQSIISEASNRRRRSSNRSRSNTISLNFSETALTPNFAATAERPNAFFPPDEFSLETVNTSTPENKDEICEDSKTASKLQKMTDEPLTEISPRKTKENQSIGTVNQHGKKQSVVMDGSVTANTDNQQHPPLKGAQEDSKEDEKSDQPEPVATGRNPSNDGNGGGDNDDDDAKAASTEPDWADVAEERLFAKHGYVKKKKIATTLQGFVYEIQSMRDGKKYVIKKTDKQLHAAGITIQNGKKYAVHEDVLNEKAILEWISRRRSAPEFMVKFVEFFESEQFYYLVMEHGGTDLFDFIIQGHKYIQEGKLAIKEWRKLIKYIFWQMSVLLLWLHNSAHCCHLDVSLENMLVQNAEFVQLPDGQLKVNTNIQIKFCDFGLGEMYDIDHSNRESGYLSFKYCGKTNYKSPQVYSKKGPFDGRKADVWSLGVVLFCMAVGAPPYKKPSDSDECFADFISKGRIAHLLYRWQRHHYVTERMLSLMHAMLQKDESQRFTIDDVVKHAWFKPYYQRYYEMIKHDLASTAH
eukprot:CAMPEP_0197023002 /NCGR_PEP_ID=MMETSP1384-20130603/3788_1 /TAXON_ID=29189 /ORGANISM="Ammonia sp." /LENGTH=592 /DNA_ID=CAMNT_0042451139 /DNA_START=105 /DNA_END=1883 /DNA_ORIENTATION=+